MKKELEFLTRNFAALKLRDPHEATVFEALIDENRSGAVVVDCFAFPAVITQEDKEVPIKKFHADTFTDEH